MTPTITCGLCHGERTRLCPICHGDKYDAFGEPCLRCFEGKVECERCGGEGEVRVKVRSFQEVA